jgi:hypothetical protein
MLFFLPVLHLSAVSIIPPLLNTHSPNYHPSSIKFFSQYFCFLCQDYSTFALYTFVRLPHILNRIFLPVLHISPDNIIPPMLHTHSSIYNTCFIGFFSQCFSFRLSVSFHHCSTPIHPCSSHSVQYFYPSTSVFTCPYQTTIAPYTSIHLPHTLQFLAYYAWPRMYPSRSCKRNAWRQHVHRATRRRSQVIEMAWRHVALATTTISA